MAKKAKAAGDDTAVRDLVTKALVTVATAEGFVRLTGAGDYEAVLGKKAPDKAAAAELTGEPPLVTVIGSGKQAYLQLTPAGLMRVSAALPEDQIGPAAKRVALALPAGEQVAFLQEFLPQVPAAASDLEPVLADAVRRQGEETEARVAAERVRAERAETNRAALERCLTHLTQLQAGRVEELKKLLVAAGGTIPEPTKHPAHEPEPKAHHTTKATHTDEPPKPRTTEDRDFQRDMAERLVTSWRDAVNHHKEEARQFLETALDNISGMRRIGEEGENVPFDGAYHESIPGVFTDHPITITRSGWSLEDSEGREYVIQKAQVKN